MCGGHTRTDTLRSPSAHSCTHTYTDGRRGLAHASPCRENCAATYLSRPLCLRFYVRLTFCVKFASDAESRIHFPARFQAIADPRRGGYSSRRVIASSSIARMRPLRGRVYRCIDFNTRGLILLWRTLRFDIYMI